METKLAARPLKVCSTCRHWSYKYKGLCTRLNQGVGKFWICAQWSAALDASSQPGRPSSLNPQGVNNARDSL